MFSLKLKWIILCWFLLLSAAPDETKELKVLIQPQSVISIQGQSNVNTFEFVQEGSFVSSAVKVSLNNSLSGMLTSSVYMPVELKKFTCENKKMLHDFLEILQADKYPVMGITLHRIEIKEQRKESGRLYASGNVIVSINLSGYTSFYSLPFDVTRDAGRYVVLGEKILRFSDFNLKPPVKFMGLVRVKNELYVQIRLVFSA